MENAIEVQNMTKVFRVLHRERSLKAAALKWARFRFPRREEFVALHDISFAIPTGQSVGVIGRNGSGKSTLLSLMSRIYRATSGRITVRGRVATLLELGAGFHPEFTGTENVFLNGVILGVPRDELERRLPAIIEFAEIGDFMDTPVKHFSSGMLTRLGFSVAVNSEPDVFLVDEVLAVGDAHFQEKCYAKIEEFKQRGVTIFFVSHDMEAIKRVSDRVLWIDDHTLRADGSPEEVVAAYQEFDAR
ncbi:MAG: lipopolysaccharide transport system ATP-binding protein [Abditibacteriota bacterium]|nr:lipopolysaccharide transport system ATP-binding protein [Abditibacteriota bacterium]